jgi:hypothetical protein
MSIGRGRKLVKEDRWSRIFEEESNNLTIESKFDTDGLSISSGDLEKDWKGWDQAERISFVGAFTGKPQFSIEDESILEFLMRNGNSQTWLMLALSLRFHSNKQMVIEFLMEQMKSDFRPKANFEQALGVIGDQSAIPVLLSEYDSDRVAIASSQNSPPDTDLIIDYLCCCSALLTLGAPGDYVNEIRKYIEHPDQAVRQSAIRRLGAKEP